MTQFNVRKENTEYYIIMANNEVIGSVELDFINREIKECAVCRLLISDAYRTQGYGTHALKILVEYAFYALDMNRVYLSVFDFNIGAIKCYKKAGFIEYNRAVRDNGWIAIQMEIHNPTTSTGV